MNSFPLSLPAGYTLIEKSCHKVGNASVCMADAGNFDVLFSDADLGFESEICGGLYMAKCNHKNAALLRTLFPFTAPRRVLGDEKTVGVGDRLGIAGEGLLSAFAASTAIPVLAQQSMRELSLTNRTYEDVLDAATFAVFKCDYQKGFGADGDHLKKAEDIENALKLGFTMITLDCSDYIRNDCAALSDADIAATCKTEGFFKDELVGKTFTLDNGETVSFTESDYNRAAAVYGDALNYSDQIYNRFFRDGKYKADFELSIDETLTPTSPMQHFFISFVLQKRGITPATVAPRFCGEFQKGIDYIGDLAQFESEIETHAAIARYFGYKLSVHSGSDKFSVFPAVARATKGRFHLKTAGTHWLEAMRVVAQKDPALYREVHAFALENMDEARKYYHVTTDMEKIPPLSTLSDDMLPTLFDQNDPRQLIHITYGLILSDKEHDFYTRLYALWRREAAAYAAGLFTHLNRHLKPLGCIEK